MKGLFQYLRSCLCGPSLHSLPAFFESCVGSDRSVSYLQDSLTQFRFACFLSVSTASTLSGYWWVTVDIWPDPSRRYYNTIFIEESLMQFNINRMQTDPKGVHSLISLSYLWFTFRCLLDRLGVTCLSVHAAQPTTNCINNWADSFHHFVINLHKVNHIHYAVRTKLRIQRPLFWLISVT